MDDITRLLQRAEQKDPTAAAELLDVVYGELRRIAAHRVAQERAGFTLQPTALVHEAWLRLGGDDQPAWRNRAHFFAAAAEAMRRIVIDSARRRRAQRRGGGKEHVDLDQVEIATPEVNDEQILSVHEALDALAVLDARKAELVKLRYFVGLTIEEAASALGISVPTAKRDWAFARAWLFNEIRREPN